MATTVVSLPLPLPVESNPSEARKRRREILSSQRNLATPDPSLSSSTATAAATTVMAAPEGNKRRRVSDCTSSFLPPVVSPSSPPPVALSGSSSTAVGKSATTGKAKKPQMKYDPDVPMTKEEAAAWRREQRRKRNRESAAASRQRQRDRIVELEEEVDVWKAKFDEAMKRIQALDGGATAADLMAPADVAAIAEPSLSSPQEHHEVIITTRPAEEEEEDSSDGLFIHSPEALVEEVFRDTTFLISPSHSPRSVSPAGSPMGVSSSSVSSSEEQEDIIMEEDPNVVVTKLLPPTKMISRPAVKIVTGGNHNNINKALSSSSLPLLPDETMLGVGPDLCSSSGAPAVTLAPIDSAMAAIPMPATTLTDVEENEAEFGEFLLDAVDWL